MEVGVIFISLETASIWCNSWKGATKASSPHGDSFISGSGCAASRILRWCWRWDGAGLNWTFDCSWARMCRTVGFTSRPCCCSWDSPRILLWKLCPVRNLLSVISALKDLVVVSENSVFTGFETWLTERFQWAGRALSWSRTPFPELCPTVFCDTHAQAQPAYGELHSSSEFEGKTWHECYGLVFFFSFSNLAWAVF